MIKVGIIGGTGYTGVELVRMLSTHDEVELSVITSRKEYGKKISDLYPNLRGFVDINFSTLDIDNLKKCDVVFCATPNGIAMTVAQELYDAKVKLIDLAADFRFTDVDLWSKWYNMKHASENLLQNSVYGLAEVNRDKIKNSLLVANPGCYPTVVQLALLPLLEANIIETDNIIADCKSGVSGAGRGASVATLQSESSENFKPYAVDGHRHLPEINHNLSKMVGKNVSITFVPHLVPMIRGMEATIYVKLIDTSVDVQKLYEDKYKNERFVDVLPASMVAETKWVKGSNSCKISLHKIENSNTLVIVGVIDNLVKGAAGQAIQNMNIMFGFEEFKGLEHVALMP